MWRKNLGILGRKLWWTRPMTLRDDQQWPPCFVNLDGIFGYLWMIKFAAKEYDILWNLSGGPCNQGWTWPKNRAIFVCQASMPYLVWNILERQGVLGDWEIHTNDDTPTVAVNFGLETGPSGDRFRQRFIWVKVQHFQCGQTLIRDPMGPSCFLGPQFLEPKFSGRLPTANRLVLSHEKYEIIESLDDLAFPSWNARLGFPKSWSHQHLFAWVVCQRTEIPFAEGSAYEFRATWCQTAEQISTIGAPLARCKSL